MKIVKNRKPIEMMKVPDDADLQAYKKFEEQLEKEEEIESRDDNGRTIRKT